MKNIYRTEHKNADDKNFDSLKKAVEYAKSNCGWNYGVKIYKNDELIHVYKTGYDNYIYDDIV
jgi:hypothetical protein